MIETGIPEIDIDELLGKIQAEVRSIKGHGPSDNAPFSQNGNPQPTIISSTSPSVFTLRDLETRRFHFEVDELLKYEDREFILRAYESILWRKPDSDGFDYFLAHLRSGMLSKSEILGRLRFSTEGRKKKVRIEGLLGRFVANSLLRIFNAGAIVRSLRK
jgi:hypothetical protein